MNKLKKIRAIRYVGFALMIPWLYMIDSISDKAILLFVQFAGIALIGYACYIEDLLCEDLDRLKREIALKRIREQVLKHQQNALEKNHAHTNTESTDSATDNAPRSNGADSSGCA